jgi:hypothetical protein
MRRRGIDVVETIDNNKWYIVDKEGCVKGGPYPKAMRDFIEIAKKYSEILGYSDFKVPTVSESKKYDWSNGNAEVILAIIDDCAVL